MRAKAFLPLLFTLVFLLLLVPIYSLTSPVSADPDGGTVLTLLHNNDGESSLLPLEYVVPPNIGYPNEVTVTLDVGSVAAFKTVTDEAIGEARSLGHSVVNVYAGDAFLPSSELRCSLPPFPEEDPVWDAVAQRQIAYDAHIFGNHEFDLGPGFLRRFIRDFAVDGELDQPFLSANLDFSQAEGYDELIDPDGLIVGETTDGRVIAHSLLLTDSATNESFGIIGATTPELPTISSPGDVQVTTSNITETAGVVQQEIDRLYDNYGVQKIIFVSHLQSVENDRQLIALLRRVDVAVAGGGDEVLVNLAVPTEEQLLPGELAPIQGDYPTEVLDADGRTVYLVTTAGNYKYLGRVDVEFDAEGEVSNVLADSSYPRPVIPESDIAADLGLENAVPMDQGIVETVYDPLLNCIEDFANTVVARSEIYLDVSRAGVRGRESNAGDMIADSFLYVYQLYSDTNNLPTDAPVVAVQNGGGIRQNAGDVIPTGDLPGLITRQNTIDVLPFFNFVTAITSVTPDQFKSVMEHSAALLPEPAGRFLQVGGFQVTYDISNSAGNRVISVMLDDGTAIVENGEVVEGAPNVTVVTNSFTADGGDDYQTFAAIPDENKVNLITTQGVALDYEAAWLAYLQSDEFPIEGDPPLHTIQAEDSRYQYPDGAGRITILTEPTAITLDTLAAEPVSTSPWLLAAGMLLLVFSGMVMRRRLR
ncbi:MAG: 5'-nucleotidase C-terminal domain-containing protein [Chloroflexota bacterium]|nr:5'-nucleotidase C-terminal domain-containing protein [Chloroflexota bacterium]